MSSPAPLIGLDGTLLAGETAGVLAGVPSVEPEPQDVTGSCLLLPFFSLLPSLLAAVMLFFL